MAENRGINTNRTSFNEKQLVDAKVVGVLKRNNEIRNQVLSKNVGKYAMYDNVLNPAIGEYYDIDSRPDNYVRPIGEGGLLKYTTSNNSELGKELNDRYFRNEDELDVFNITNPDPITLARWGGKYDNYIKYVADTYGKETKFINFLIDRLGEDNIKYAMNDERVGIVKNINPSFSLAGVMITNINNFTGKDTPLGTITNTLYAKTLENAAYFNTLRRQNRNYITPSLIGAYGNNLTNLNRLSDLFPISDNTGRLSYNVGDFVKVSKLDEEYDTLSDFYNAFYYKNDAVYDTNNKKILSNLIATNDSDSDGFESKNIGYTPFAPYAKLVKNTDIAKDLELMITSGRDTYYENNNSGKIVRAFSEGDIANSTPEASEQYGNTNFQEINSNNGKDGSIPERNKYALLDKTCQLFNEHKIATLVGRFHTSVDSSPNHDEVDLLQNAVSRFGISHGRNLLKKGRKERDYASDNVNGYSNPYCRVWTYHHQYAKVKNMIRPFMRDNGTGAYTIEEIQNDQVFSRHKTGAKYLANNTVLDSNGFVNITPTSDGVDIKKCMFSIENLAWKDVYKSKNNISNEQVGPQGGRIMWFPPYNIKFNEYTNVEWNEHNFIGRGEKIYTYVNTDRNANLSFTLLVDHPSILDYWAQGKESTQETDDDILRFFAGCAPFDFSDRVEEKENEVNEPDNAILLEPKETLPEEGINIIFYTYFPNNYSGISDRKSMVDPLTYLFKGIGSQKRRNKDNANDVKDIGLLSFEKNDNPGYEMSDNSITRSKSDGNYIKGAYGNWRYRVDDEYINQRLLGSGNYNDNKSSHLNSDINNDRIPTDANYTFAEVYAGANYNVDGVVDWAISCGARKENIEKFYNLIKDDNAVLTTVELAGMASTHGHKNLNSKLNKNRKDTLERFIRDKFNKKIEKDNPIFNNGVDIIPTDSNSTDDISAKLGRCARVELVFKQRKIETVSNTNPYTSNTEVKSNKNEFIEDNTVLPPTNNGGLTGNRYSISNAKKPEVSVIVKRDINKEIDDRNNRYGKRYENEAQFFQRLNTDSPLIRDKIVEKVKYFDPAFHSISPEGFNARLTFLQQCTRQGHTDGAAEKNTEAKHAGNLAFGRAPVCVLRIGDFFNTKIIIQSLSIDYEPLVWDLNPEGIGVQPMLANVNMSFVIVGGSSLSGPISRLQNAVSFNYYANSGVYDDRADTVVYENTDTDYGTSKVRYTNIFSPEKKQ